MTKNLMSSVMKTIEREEEERHLRHDIVGGRLRKVPEGYCSICSGRVS